MDRLKNFVETVIKQIWRTDVRYILRRKKKRQKEVVEILKGKEKKTTFFWLSASVKVSNHVTMPYHGLQCCFYFIEYFCLFVFCQHKHFQDCRQLFLLFFF